MDSNRDYLCKTLKQLLEYLTFLAAFVLFLNMNAFFKRVIVLWIPYLYDSSFLS